MLSVEPIKQIFNVTNEKDIKFPREEGEVISEAMIRYYVQSLFLKGEGKGVRERKW